MEGRRKSTSRVKLKEKRRRRDWRKREGREETKKLYKEGVKEREE